MKWVVKGVYRNTGKDSTITVEAEDEDKAGERASFYGVLVEKMEADSAGAGGVAGVRGAEKGGACVAIRYRRDGTASGALGARGLSILEGIICAGFGTIGVLCMVGGVLMV